MDCRCDDRRIGRVAVEGPGKPAEKDAVGDGLNRLVRRADPVEEQEVQARHQDDRHEENNDRPRMVERIVMPCVQTVCLRV